MIDEIEMLNSIIKKYKKMTSYSNLFNGIKGRYNSLKVISIITLSSMVILFIELIINTNSSNEKYNSFISKIEANTIPILVILLGILFITIFIFNLGIISVLNEQFSIKVKWYTLWHKKENISALRSKRYENFIIWLKKKYLKKVNIDYIIYEIDCLINNSKKSFPIIHAAIIVSIITLLGCYVSRVFSHISLSEGLDELNRVLVIFFAYIAIFSIIILVIKLTIETFFDTIFNRKYYRLLEIKKWLMKYKLTPNNENLDS